MMCRLHLLYSSWAVVRELMNLSLFHTERESERERDGERDGRKKERERDGGEGDGGERERRGRASESIFRASQSSPAVYINAN